MVPGGQCLGAPAMASAPASARSTPLSGLSRASTPETGPRLPDEIDMKTPANHLDFSLLLPLFPSLESLVLTFQTSSNLAAAYGIAVTGARPQSAATARPSGADG